MSIVCGIASLTKDKESAESWIGLFRREISRCGYGDVSDVRGNQCYLIKLDVDAFSGSGWESVNDLRWGALAGDPVFPDRSVGKNRNDDLIRLLRGNEVEIVNLLRRARGNFSFALCSSKENSLVVGTDRLGLRPVYWTRIGDIIIFSGVLRILLRGLGAALEPNMKGLIESIAFGFPLADRTEYEGIRVLEGGEYLWISDGIFQKKRYWDWCSDTGQPEDETPDLRRQLHEEFLRSIELRSAAGKGVYAALSGGLDSRCVVGGLTELGRDVRAINVSWLESLDQILARKMAQAISVPCHQDILDRDQAGDYYFPRSIDVMRKYQSIDGISGYQANQLWGGNDGSISVGYLYVTREMVSALRAGEYCNAAAEFISHRKIGVSHRIFARRYAKLAVDQPAQSIVEILQSIRREDYGQKMFIFLLLANQRRMLQRDFEDVDRNRVERIEPFFDTDFLALTCRLPVDASIGHGLFTRWLDEFPGAIREVPWQTYPGHEPCPLELPPEYESQWALYSKHNRPAFEQRILSEFDQISRNERNSRNILDWSKLRMMRLVRRARVIDGLFSFQQAVRIHKLLSPIEEN